MKNQCDGCMSGNHRPSRSIKLELYQYLYLPDKHSLFTHNSMGCQKHIYEKTFDELVNEYKFAK